MAFHTNHSGKGNKGEAAIARRMAYAKKRHQELIAAGETEDAAWARIKEECQQGKPEQEHAASKANLKLGDNQP